MGERWSMPVLGVALLAAALKTWRGRPEPGQEAPPLGGSARGHDFTIARAGCRRPCAFRGSIPKNVGADEVAAAAGIDTFGLPTDQQVAVLLAFVVLASIGVLTPLTVSLALGDGSRALLDNMKGWMARNNAVIMTVLFVLIGAKLIGDAISGFA